MSDLAKGSMPTPSGVATDISPKQAMSVVWVKGMECPECGQPVHSCPGCGQSLPEMKKGAVTAGMAALGLGASVAGYAAASAVRNRALKCKTCGQPKPSVAKSADLDVDFGELVKRAPMQAIFVANDLHRVADLWDNEATRPQAEALLKEWSETGEPLRKAMSSAWLARAKAVLAKKVLHARHEIKGAWGKKAHHPGATAEKPTNQATFDTAEHVEPRIEK